MNRPTRRANSYPDAVLSMTCARLLQAFDGTVVLLLGTAPLLMGGRHPAGRVVYLALIALLALIWALVARNRGSSFRRCGLELPALGAICLLVLQVTPLSPERLSLLSPRLAHFLPLWRGEDGVVGRDWSTLSIVPSETRMGLAWLIASIVLLSVLYQRYATRRELRRLLNILGIVSVWLAVFSLAQYLLSNGKFVWIYQNPFRDTRDVVRGPFYNQNHLAHCLILGIVPLWAFYLHRRRQQATAAQQFMHAPNRIDELKTMLLGLSVPLVLFVVLLTQSRGGMLVAAIVVAFGAAGTWQRSEDWRKQSARLGLIVGAIVVGLLVHGLSDVTQEASTLTSGSIERLDKGAGRRQIWRSAREILGQFTLTGAGVGSFRNAYPLYYAEPREYDYGYAESGYLNVAAETGLAGLGVLCAALGILMRRSIPLVLASWQRRWGDDEDRELVTAAACGVMASAVHSLFDFVWFVPACWVATVCLIVVVLRLHQLSADEVDERTNLLTDRARHRTSHAGVQPIGLAFTGAFLLLVAVRGVSLAAAAMHWDAYLIAIRQDENEQEFSLTATDSRVEVERLAMAHQRLRKIVQLDPSFVPARVHLSAVCLQRFELEQAMSDNPMSLAQIRDAALSSAFISLEQQNKWLDAVMSDRKLFLLEAAATTRSILALAPFQGRAYVDLAELSFLEKLGGLDRSQLIQQALRVRPHDGMVLFAAGREAALSGDFAACVGWWQHAYRQDRKLRLTITTQLAPLLPAPAFLDSFAPTLPDLVTLQQMYQHRQQVDDALFVARAYVERLTAGSAEEQTTAYDWQQGYRLAAELQDPRVLMIARHAVELDPLNDVMRRRLAYEQLEQGQLSAAIQNLETYIRSNPADKRTAEKLAWAKQEARRL